MIGIVGTTDGIDIRRLDNLHVLFHHFPRNGAPVIGMGFMAVDTLELDGSAVNPVSSTHLDVYKRQTKLPA